LGDNERDIFWLGTALLQLAILASARAAAKGANSVGDILGQIIATYRRIGISGNLLSDAERWATTLSAYQDGVQLSVVDSASLTTEIVNWIKSLSDLFKAELAFPGGVSDRLSKIDLIYDAVSQFQTTEHQFTYTSPDARGIKDKVTTAIDAATNQDEILLTGYFDNALVDKILRGLRKGVQMRIIVPTYRQNERDNIDATRRIKRANAAVREHHAIHARIAIFGIKSMLVSSADPKTDGLDQNFEAGIWTTNATLVQEGKHFFESIWNESTEWNM
jgi:phosphatidylserine/phosphatidylglycerophosphate/cardiolipin synthase-like enzyme